MVPEPYPLTNAYFKADRAKLHLDALQVAVDGFCADACVIAPQEEPEWDRVRYRITLKQPHVGIYLILGDVLQCLRTALDQSIWSLIHHATGTDRDKSEFPIFGPRFNSEDRRRFRQSLEGLSDIAISYVESIQPYNRPHGLPYTTDPLWRLHGMNRIDKHRRISVQSQLSFAGRTFFGATAPSADFALMYREKTDYGYDVVCSGSCKHFEPKITTFVLFGEEETGIITIDEIRQIYNFVTYEVLPKLAGFAK